MNDMLLLGAEIGHYFEMKARAVMRMRRLYEKFIWKLICITNELIQS